MRLAEVRGDKYPGEVSDFLVNEARSPSPFEGGGKTRHQLAPPPHTPPGGGERFDGWSWRAKPVVFQPPVLLKGVPKRWERTWRLSVPILAPAHSPLPADPQAGSDGGLCVTRRAEYLCGRAARMTGDPGLPGRAKAWHRPNASFASDTQHSTASTASRRFRRSPPKCGRWSMSSAAAAWPPMRQSPSPGWAARPSCGAVPATMLPAIRSAPGSRRSASMCAMCRASREPAPPPPPSSSTARASG